MRQINYQSIPKKPVSISCYTRLDGIFQKKGWDKSNAATEIMDRYRNTLSILDLKEQVLFLDLTERFKCISLTQYEQELNKTLDYLCGKNPNKKIYFTRCVGKKDLNKTKSSDFVLYLFKAHIMRYHLSLPYQTVDDIRNINVSELNDGSALLVLVDDFIGTGNTAIKALEYVYDCFPGLMDDSSIVFLSIASLKEGVDKIREMGFHLYTSNIFKKGLSDYYRGNQLVQVKEWMKSIERKLQVERRFHFGYKKSEALLCMQRCPNNTFPVYWYSIGLAPYER